MKIWTVVSTVLSQFTRVRNRQTDRQTNRWTDRPRLHAMQRGNEIISSIIISRSFAKYNDLELNASKYFWRPCSAPIFCGA